MHGAGMSKLTHLQNAQRVENSIVTVGTFDGVHAGHRVLINNVLKKAEQKNARSVVVTFDPHPRDIISPGEEGIKLLTTLEERCELLAEIGIDEMIVIPFNRDFSLLSSESFVRDIIWKKIGISEFVIGYDHQFGRNREGTIETVQQLGKEFGFEVHIVSKQEVGDKTVSSTAIRKCLQENGDVQLAARLLERPYPLNGTVIHGDNRGKDIGFPTANIKPEHPNKVIPKKGVYTVTARIENQTFKGMMNIGTRPTFDGDQVTLEVHLFDFDRNIYGNAIKIFFHKRLRDEKRFSGVDALVNQLQEDKIQSLEFLKKVDLLPK
jgi:riboflavin kinase / FMN adenylyltransferase